MGAKAAQLSPEKLAALRSESKAVRAAVEKDKSQIAQQRKEVIERAVASGKLLRVQAVFRADEQEEVKAALDRYAQEHGIQSHSQVARLALCKLLKLDLPASKWGRAASD